MNPDLHKNNELLNAIRKCLEQYTNSILSGGVEQKLVMSAICHAIQADDNKTGLPLGKKAQKGTSESPHPKAYLIVVKNFEDDNGLITVKCEDSATLLIDGEEKKIRLTVERILIEEDSAFKVKGEVYRAKKVYQK